MSTDHGMLPTDRRTVLRWMAAASAGSLFCDAGSLLAADSDFVPQPGKFPSQPGNDLAGELVTVDAINRRGGLRLDGDFNDDRYDKAQPHDFAMLPYGMIYYHGAPAELRDTPLGTHLHGSFYLPPSGEEETIPPTKGPPQYGSKYNHAILLEDDFSFYQRRGQAWKIASLDREAGGRSPHHGPGRLRVVSTGKQAPNGLEGEQTFWIDSATRVWRGRELADWDALAADQVVQVNLSWSPEWRNREFRVLDIWVDEESRSAATERQRRLHVHYQRHRWLAGWVDHVEHTGGSRGIVTITLFGGMDSSLYTDAKAGKTHGISVAAAESTLRTYWQDHDHKSGSVIEILEQENPPLGSSGIQIRWKTDELLDGFRPGRFVRVRPHLGHWPNVKLPPEERLR